jgi:two-component system, NtrC family, sensor kinase
MKVATKIALAISAVFALVLLFSSALIATDEIRYADEQVARHGRLLGRVVASTVEETWRDRGESEARALLNDINEQEPRITVRWVSLDPGAGDYVPDPRVDDTERLRLLNGEVLTAVGGSDDDTLYTYVPLVHDGHDRAIEIAEPLAARNEHVRGIQTLLFGLGFVGFGTSAAMAYALGRRYVSRPVGDLVALARRVGQSDFSAPAPESGTDELASLAHEMNQMAADLAQSEAHAAELERTRQDAQLQLEHAERLATVGQLAAGVAHEIGTPLQAISLRANLIAARAGHIDGVEDFTHAIEAQSQQVGQIVRNLLSFARRRPPRSVRRDLRDVVGDAVALIEAAHPSHRLRIEVQLPSAPLLAEADAEQLGHVVTNLLINGMHATPAGGRLTVGLDRRVTRPPTGAEGLLREYGCVWVQDEGTGIPPDVVPHIFEPFFTTKPRGEGTGLGLSIVYGIVKEHRGWIDVRTQVGEGTRFTIYLPVADADVASDDTAQTLPSLDDVG